MTHGFLEPNKEIYVWHMRIPGKKSSTGNWETQKNPLISPFPPKKKPKKAVLNPQKKNIFPVCDGANLVKVLLLCFLMSDTKLTS